ncbi:transcription factor PAP1-domain-containing protein [Pseudomassariella vexata]|uniref:Transcription factor PAP1-domain-containing protein n=1 Tax=Pseudomassariella vexata TaxID=1141098 RepID=A0A1Y2DQC8_9PEZI|nr:transcription factor PAP1-domain-containing protein [Pseudomassariella vexata]ORY61316.1 transcription factor PAP1-domain-containing protein [Pseudomassariella vexata]
MASPRTDGLPPNFILTPQQQNLLFRALTSNQPTAASPPRNPLSLSPHSFTASPQQNDSSAGDSNVVQESPYLDYDYDFDPNGNFDFDLTNDNVGKMIGDLPSTTHGSSNGSSPENDGGDKRSHPDEDTDDKEEGGGKRRESEGKVPKKPGRKPLTNEPSSKRKAQNRAAQRAFRERKEQHLKDLETKVKELEKASESTNSENNQLRAQVEKMTMELNEYKKRLLMMNNSSRPAPLPRNPPRFGQGLVNNLNDVNFHFEFPKFGMLPGPQTTTNANKDHSSLLLSATNVTPHSQSRSPDKSKDQASSATTTNRENSDAQRDALSKFCGMLNNSPYDTANNNASRSSLDSTSCSLGGGTNSGSPSSSSTSNAGPSSSCGTSPEPFTQSPLGSKPLDTLTTIGEEQLGLIIDNPSHFSEFGNVDFTNFDWLTQQNGGQFDPQLFGDYREPQENILSNNAFDDSFFNDAFDADFTTPFNVAPTPNLPKTNLVAEIDAAKENDDTIVAGANGRLLTCNNIWEKLQNCPKVQTGDIDLDGLCSDLQKKAKCGGSGAVVDEKDFKAVMTKHLGESANLCTGP